DSAQPYQRAWPTSPVGRMRICTRFTLYLLLALTSCNEGARIEAPRNLDPLGSDLRSGMTLDEVRAPRTRYGSGVDHQPTTAVRRRWPVSGRVRRRYDLGRAGRHRAGLFDYTTSAEEKSTNATSSTTTARVARPRSCARGSPPPSFRDHFARTALLCFTHAMPTSR